MSKAGFVMLPSYYDAIRPLSSEDRLRMYDALMDYAFAGKYPEDLPPLLNGYFVLLKPNIDSSVSKYAASVENGKKGGRPKKKPNENPAQTQRKPSNKPVEKQEKERERELEKEFVAATPPHPRFIPPTVDEIKAYCTGRKNTVDAERFFDYYSANGWKQGRGKPIVDWKAAVRTWERQNNAGQAVPPSRQYDAVTDTWR